MRIGLGQINPTIGDFAGNRERIADTIRRARAMRCDLVIFPELAVTGYPPQDLLLKRAFVQESVRTLDELQPLSQEITVILGYVEPNPGEGRPLFNCAAVLSQGRIVHKTRKILLPTYDVFDEDRYFEPGTHGRTWQFQDWTFGLSICEDAWNDKDYWKRRRYRKDPMEELVRAGADILINIAASPFHVGKIRFRREMLQALARKYRKPVIMVNTAGANDELIFDGSSCVINHQGEIVHQCPSFREDLAVIEWNGEAFQGGNGAPDHEEDIDQVYHALRLGIAEYTRKCGFTDVLVAVSGGIDSAVTATLAVHTLGAEHVTGVFMPSRFTSKESYEDARKLAAHLGIRWVEIPIDSMFKAFQQPLRQVDPSLRRVTEENLQARIRGNILMALSNQWDALVLSTGNKSELALGYCTLYGDMTGGLAVLGDVPKTMVYELARFLNREREVIPQRILDKPPSAELRPGQKDEDDIPPYALVDRVIRMYIEEERSLPDIVRSGIDPETAREIVHRIDRNEFKRRQAPLTLKVTSRAFGSGRRVPIAQKFRHPLAWPDEGAPAVEPSAHRDPSPSE